MTWSGAPPTEVPGSADADETDRGGTTFAEATSGTSADDVGELPSIGAGTVVSASAYILLVTLLSGIAVLCSFAVHCIQHDTLGFPNISSVAGSFGHPSSAAAG